MTTSDTSSVVMPTTKTCSCCKRELPLDAFAMKYPARGIRQSQCRECTRAASRRHYEQNRDAIIAKSASNKATKQKELRDAVKAQLKGKACSCCGKKRNLAFKLNPGYEGPRVSAAVNQGMSLETVQASIENSSIICRVCEHKASYESGLKPYMDAKKSGVEFVGNGLTRAEQKSRSTRSTKDLRLNRAEEGRLLVRPAA